MELVIPRLEKFASEGLFGEINLLRVRSGQDDDKGVGFQSEVGFYVVDLVTQKGKVRPVPVVVKIQPADVKSREESVDIQFHNEVVMYQKILPQLGATELKLCPILYYGAASIGQDPTNDLIVMEDLGPQGYKVPKKTFMDHDHMLLAMLKIGQLHGLSYKFKNSSPGTIRSLAGSLHGKHFWYAEGYSESSLLRGFEAIMEGTPPYSVVKRAYKKLTSQRSDELRKKLDEPEEPFAVVVHGDLTNNNVMYKYDDSGKVNDLKFFDFGASAYSDPSTDIAVFLYLHSSKETRVRWDDYLETYWKGVVSVEANPGFTFEEFKKNFAKRAISGYLISSFYLPVLLDKANVNQLMNMDEKPLEEKAELGRNYGGDEATIATTSIVRHLLDEGYLEEYLLHFN